MPVIEFAKLTAREEFINDRNAAKELFDLIRSSEGCLGVYHGLQHEDKTTAIIFVVWETYEHHQKLNDAPRYAKVQELGNLLFTNTRMRHFTVDVDPNASLTAPITEIAHFKPKDSEIKEGLGNLLGATDLVGAAKGAYPPPALGEVRENPQEYYLTVGWETVESHFEAIGQGELKLAVEKLFSTFDLTVEHVALVKHV